MEFFLEKCRKYMSTIITIVSNITVLVSHNIIFLNFLCLLAMVSVRRLLQVFLCTSIPSTRFSAGLFVVLQEVLYQPSFAVLVFEF